MSFKNHQRCGKLNKACRNKKCPGILEQGSRHNTWLYHFPAGDRAIYCSHCGEDRRCRNPKVGGFNVCRMHGANNVPKIPKDFRSFNIHPWMDDQELKPKKRSYIYLARRSDGKHKIGRSDHPSTKRVFGLESATSVMHEMVCQVQVLLPSVIEKLVLSHYSEFVSSELETRGRELFDFGNEADNIEREFPYVVRQIAKELDSYLQTQLA